MQQSTLPFLGLHQTAYDTHYAQAYMRTQPATITEASPLRLPSSSAASWNRPGNCRCSYKGCSFAGSQKTLEVHMMDRHLIYPPGWEKRPRKSDWDADPTMKGKPFIIQGTSLTLDNPEDLKAWLKERKNRWPTTARVEDKKRKLEEAVASGHLLAGNSNLGHRKRQRLDDHPRGNRGKGRARATDSGWNSRQRTRAEQPNGSEGIQTNSHISPSIKKGDACLDEDDDVPEICSSKQLPQKLIDRKNNSHVTKYEKKAPTSHSKAGPQPKQPHNPFAARPTLLRNLLLPDIRVTISNLSQAVRFFVDNDFLQDVEVRPGGAEEERIQVVESCTGVASDTRTMI